MILIGINQHFDNQLFNQICVCNRFTVEGIGSDMVTGRDDNATENNNPLHRQQ